MLAPVVVAVIVCTFVVVPETVVTVNTWFPLESTESATVLLPWMKMPPPVVSVAPVVVGRPDGAEVAELGGV